MPNNNQRSAQTRKDRIIIPTPPDENSCYIPLSQGLCALVDKADYDWLMQWNWSACPIRYTAYAYRTIGHGKKLAIHQAIMQPPPGMQVDHINHDGLDNRRANLRIVTRAENLRNRRVFRNSKAGIKGVRYEDGKGWKMVFARYFDTAEEAAEARQRIEGFFDNLH